LWNSYNSYDIVKLILYTTIIILYIYFIYTYKNKIWFYFIILYKKNSISLFLILYLITNIKGFEKKSKKKYQKNIIIKKKFVIKKY